ncbi:component of the polarisome [Entophlyctis luteolus]|nr:component of the polarisome [Entophlyctis luteolus]KAJ3383637.1 component of the polarisome [Entophlyctis sp. JEL0112]
MDSLPPELHLAIAVYLRNPVHLCRLSSSCRQLRHLWFSEAVWRTMLEGVDATPSVPEDFHAQVALLSSFLDLSTSTLGASAGQNAKEEIMRWTKSQFIDNATDVTDEIKRRQADNPDVPFLPPSDLYQPTRNQFRQKLATIPAPKFKELATDILLDLKRRFPQPVSGQRFMQEYVSRTTKVLAPDMRITWMEHDEYWRLMDNIPGVTDVVGSMHYSPKVAQLVAVCWLDVTATLMHVPSGMYQPQLRISTRRPSQVLKNCEVSAEVKSAGSLPPIKVSLLLTGMISNNVVEASYPWLVLSLPPIYLSESGASNNDGLHTVEFKIKDLSGHWKSGLVIDYFSLVRVQTPPNNDTDKTESTGSILGGLVSQVRDLLGV